MAGLPVPAGMGSSTSPASRYERLECIGRGSFGKVYRGVDRETGNEVAIKVIDLEDVEDGIEDIYKEISVLAGCRCNHITRYFGCALQPSGTELNIVMELMAGSVADLIDYQQLDERVIAYLLHETLCALAYLHGEHRVHRDVKAANILVSDAGAVKLTDFGVTGQLTNTYEFRRKTFVGTPYWMAPEVIANSEGAGYTETADVWSVGITAIEMAKGRPPNADTHPMRVLFRIPKEPPPVLEGAYSREFKDFVATCLQKEPKLRPSVRELLHHPFLASTRAGAPPEWPALVREFVTRPRGNPLEAGYGTSTFVDGSATTSSSGARGRSGAGSEDTVPSWNFQGAGGTLRGATLRAAAGDVPSRPPRPPLSAGTMRASATGNGIGSPAGRGLGADADGPGRRSPAGYGYGNSTSTLQNGAGSSGKAAAAGTASPPKAVLQQRGTGTLASGAPQPPGHYRTATGTLPSGASAGMRMPAAGDVGGSSMGRAGNGGGAGVAGSSVSYSGTVVATGTISGSYPGRPTFSDVEDAFAGEPSGLADMSTMRHTGSGRQQYSHHHQQQYGAGGSGTRGAGGPWRASGHGGHDAQQSIGGPRASPGQRWGPGAWPRARAQGPGPAGDLPAGKVEAGASQGAPARGFPGPANLTQVRNLLQSDLQHCHLQALRPHTSGIIGLA